LSKQLTVEIHGTGTHNRGAELMAIAIADRLREKFSSVRIVVPFTFGDYESRAKYKFWTTSEIRNWFQKGSLAIASRFPSPIHRFLAKAEMLAHKSCVGRTFILEQGGILDPREVDLVIDASGFAFSDQWGPRAATRLVHKMSLNRTGKPLILMPQAFGPFSNPKVAEATRALIARSSLCFPRDSESFLAVTDLVGMKKTVVQSPDFTIGVEPLDPVGLSLPEKYSCIVPNFRMMDKTKKANEYLCFLQHSAKSLTKHGLNPVFLLHDSNHDNAIVEELRKIGIESPCFKHPDPRILKAILKGADVVIASRFHALVSALSQGVPCVGAGWSHKYPELFLDFGCEEFLVSNIENIQMLESCLEKLACPEIRENVSRKIKNASTQLEVQVGKMWELVFSHIEALR